MRFGGIALAAVLMLGACSGDPTPKEPTGTASKPTPTSTATPPAMPDQAKEDSKEGAAAFVSHWVEASNYAAETGDVEQLSSLSSSGCGGCKTYIDLYRTTYDAGGYFRGGAWRTSDVEVADAGESFIVRVTVSWAASKFKEHADDSEHIEGAGSDKLTFEVRDQRVIQLVLRSAE